MTTTAPTGIEAAFLADIIASPGDDTPRLIYADWLQDNGQDDRAEFIRLQLAMKPDTAIWESEAGKAFWASRPRWEKFLHPELGPSSATIKGWEQKAGSLWQRGLLDAPCRH